MYIVIVGAGNIGYYLAKTLRPTDHEVLLLEKDRLRHRVVAEELGEMVMQGDGCEVRVMEEAGVNRADVIVAVTGSDDDNLVICQMAKFKFQVPHAIARVNDPRNESLFHRLGTDSTVSSTKIIYNLIEQEIETSEVIPIAALKRGHIEIVEVEISAKTPVLHRNIKEVNLPQDALIISLIRNNNALLPTAETTFEVGDDVIALVSAEVEHELRDVFAEIH